MRGTILVPKHGVTSCISSCERGGQVSRRFVDSLDSSAELIAFHPIDGIESDYLPYDSATRIGLKDEASNVVCVSLQASSSFCDIVLWDLAHVLQVGRTLTVFEPVSFDDCILQRRYFADCFEVSERSEDGWHVKTFAKVKPTLSETEAGVDRWTFGLPVSEASPKLVDKLSKDIAALGIARWEILLAVSKMPPGEPNLPSNVGLLFCGPATITEKKNLIARHAAYENLCIFHDRVELPSNFRQAIERFGDHYGIAGFQHLFFDPARRDLERYSDYHVDTSDGRTLLDTDDENERGGLYIVSLETRLRFRVNFAEAHPAEYARKNYLTGTLYLAKRALWQLVEQNPLIEWNQLEDVEFGEHAMRVFGIPSRVNPHAFGFTSRVRAVLLGNHEIVDRRNGSSIISIRNSYEDTHVGNAIASGLDEAVVRNRAWALFQEFGQPDHDLTTRQHIFFGSLASERTYAHYWVRILYRLIVPRSRDRLERMLELFSFAAFGFSYDPSTKRGLADGIAAGTFFIDAIVQDNYFLRSLANVPNLVNRRSVAQSTTPYAQAMRLWRRGGDYVYPYASFEALLTVLEDSLGTEATA